MTVFGLVMTWVSPIFLGSVSGDKRYFFDSLQKRVAGISCIYKKQAAAEMCQIHGEWDAVSRAYEILEELHTYKSTSNKQIDADVLVRAVGVVASVSENREDNDILNLPNDIDTSTSENHINEKPAIKKKLPNNVPNVTSTNEKSGNQRSCPVCDKSYQSVSSFRQHLMTHEEGYVDKPYLCTKCGKSFKNERTLLEHENVHSGKRPYSCHICSKSFPMRGSLRVHLMTHLEKKYYKCKICNKDFKQASSLRIHKHIHTGRRFECDECHKMFTQKQAMIRHKRIHTGERPLACSICGSAFNDYSILNRHLQGIHKIKNFSEMRKGAKVGTYEAVNSAPQRPRGRHPKQQKVQSNNLPNQISILPANTSNNSQPQQQEVISQPEAQTVTQRPPSQLQAMPQVPIQETNHQPITNTHLDQVLQHQTLPNVNHGLNQDNHMNQNQHVPTQANVNPSQNAMNVDHSQLLYNMYNYWGY